MTTMSEEAKKARNEYLREWRKRNPDKVAAIKARYWEKKAKEANNDDGAGNCESDGGAGQD